MKRYFTLTVLATLILGSSLALADGRDNNRGNGSYNRNADRHHFDRRIDNRQGARFNNGYNSRFNNRSSNWSVNLNLNSGWPAYSRGGFGSSYYTAYPYRFGSYTTIGGLGIVSTRNRNPVIVEHNTYINNSRPVYAEPYRESEVYTRRSPGAGTSLLKDLNGRCFERSHDALGNETRIELPATACDF